MLLYVACFEHEVKALHRVQNVDDVVVRVLLEVALRHLSRERNERLKVDVGELEQVVELEYLVDQELKTRLVQDLVEVERVERGGVDPV